MNTQQNKLLAGKNGTARMPAKISDYIKKNFRENFLTNIESYRDKRGNEIYSINISHDGTLFHLKFNSGGVLLEKHTEPLVEFYDDEDFAALV